LDQRKHPVGRFCPRAKSKRIYARRKEVLRVTRHSSNGIKVIVVREGNNNETLAAWHGLGFRSASCLIRSKRSSNIRLAKLSRVLAGRRRKSNDLQQPRSLASSAEKMTALWRWFAFAFRHPLQTVCTHRVGLEDFYQANLGNSGNAVGICYKCGRVLSGRRLEHVQFVQKIKPKSK
jgi:hypothetical protein